MLLFFRNLVDVLFTLAEEGYGFWCLIWRCESSASGLGCLEPMNLVIVPASLPLSFAVKPKNLGKKVFDIQVSRAYSVGAPKLVRLMKKSHHKYFMLYLYILQICLKPSSSWSWWKHLLKFACIGIKKY